MFYINKLSCTIKASGISGNHLATKLSPKQFGLHLLLLFSSLHFAAGEELGNEPFFIQHACQPVNMLSSTCGGGTAPFTYAWETGGDDSTETVSTHTTYEVTVTDAVNDVAICPGATTTLPVASSVIPSDLTEKPISSDSLVSCSESGLQPNDWYTKLSFAQFDPSLGALQRIELRLEGKTVASMEIEEAAIPTGQNQVKLSSQLVLQLPGEQTLRMEPVAELNESTYKLREQFTGMEQRQEVIDEDFLPYLGTGKLLIPAAGKGYNSKNKKGPIQLHTQSALSVCIYYHYQPGN
jgi:hypothetical protein